MTMIFDFEPWQLDSIVKQKGGDANVLVALDAIKIH